MIHVAPNPACISAQNCNHLQLWDRWQRSRLDSGVLRSPSWEGQCGAWEIQNQDAARNPSNVSRGDPVWMNGEGRNWARSRLQSSREEVGLMTRGARDQASQVRELGGISLQGNPLEKRITSSFLDSEAAWRGCGSTQNKWKAKSWAHC